MRLNGIVVLLAGLAACMSSAIHVPSLGPPKLKERIRPPIEWVPHGPAPSEHLIRLRIGLPQPNFSVLEQHLYAVSDPLSERYGQHLSKDDVEALVAPHPESLSRVNSWLASHGFTGDDIARSPAGDWATVLVPVRVAEQMLHTKYSVWQHTDSGEFLIRTTSYSVPQDIHPHIDVIQPTTMFGRFRAAKSTIHSFQPDSFSALPSNMAASLDSAVTIPNPYGGPEIDASCTTSITINCLKQLYNAVGIKPPMATLNSIGITGFLEESANVADLQQFYAEQLPAAVNTSFKFVSVNGSLNDQNITKSGAEAALDIQFAFGISFPIPGTFYSTPGRPPFIPNAFVPINTNEPYADWLSYVLNQTSLPLVISTSYGEPETTVPREYAVRVCQDLAQLGARGVSLLFSSGDGGVGDGSSDPNAHKCNTNDGRNITRFMPTFPGSCPFVTSVGGTTNIPEKGVSFSGGGFSDYWERPDYQNESVAKYLAGLRKELYDGLFNSSGRAFPDVSAQATNFQIMNKGRSMLISGTSASSPTFAGFVALLNDVRLANGTKPLGFLNPLLYSQGISGFNDITTGNNPGCGTPGFNATQGWDPVTGLGTPNFMKLRDIVASLPP